MVVRVPVLKWKWELSAIPTLTFGFTLIVTGTALVSGWASMQHSLASISLRTAQVELRIGELNREADARAAEVAESRLRTIETLGQIKGDVQTVRAIVERLERSNGAR